MGNLLGWIRGLWEDRGERREPLEPLEPLEPSEPSDYESTRDIPVSSDISYNVQASSDISSDVQASSDISSERYKAYLMEDIERYKADVVKHMEDIKKHKADTERYKAYLMEDIERYKADMVKHMEDMKKHKADMKADMYQSGTKSPVEETARSLTDTSAKSEILDIIQKIKQEIQGIQATRACLNPENKKFEITVVTIERPNKVRRLAKDLITERISIDLDYDLEVREISEEGIRVTNCEEFIEFFAEKGYSKEIFKLQRVISNHSDSFMENDPNITCISFSPVKSTGYGTAEHKIVKEPCIVFFVQVKFDKKRIPLGSTRIPETIEDIKTDVREGIVETLMQAPQDALSIELGCPIASEHSCGTLGPIVSTDHNTFGFLTSLHVLDPLGKLIAINHIDDEAGLETTVYKSTEEDNEDVIGNVIKVYFANGNAKHGESGYEVGLVGLHPNVHIKEGNLLANGILHVTGETTAVTEDNCENSFKKLGAETGLTKATYTGLTSIYVRYGPQVHYLCCQIQLRKYKKKSEHDVDFAKPGDSGAMVTIKEDRTDKIVGILSAKRTDDIYLVTPIQPICARLQEDGWRIYGKKLE